MSKRLRAVAIPIVAGLALGPAGLGLTSAAAGAAIGSGVNSLASGDSPTQALLSAGGSYIGSNLAGNLIGDLGTVGSAASSALGQGTVDAVSGALPSSLAQGIFNAPISSMIGSTIGGDIASSLVPQKNMNISGQTATPVAPEPEAFKPSRAQDKSAPASIVGSGALTPDQYTSGIASQGVYGSGVDNDANDYFLNMINRKLVTDAGQVDTDFADISPIENSYLAKLGLGGAKSPTDLLQAISRYKPI